VCPIFVILIRVFRRQAKAFFWNAVAFMILLYTNAKALESANVETVIVFRTLSIFATAYGDFRQLTPFPHHISIILLISCDCDAGSWTEACPTLQLSEHSASWFWARSATYSAIKDSRCLTVTHLPKTSHVTIRLVRARARMHACTIACAALRASMLFSIVRIYVRVHLQLLFAVRIKQ
jgi:hypothetical protein